MVSIILLTYNREKLVAESIKSILAQTYSKFELLVVDDGSEDNTECVVQAFNDARIQYFKMPHIGHTGVLKNFAIGKSSGEFIAFNDSDDLWKEEKLEKQMQSFDQNNSIGFSITDVTTFKDDRILIDHSYKEQNKVECINIFERLVNGQMLVYNPTLIIKRACFDKVGLFDEKMISGDYHFNMRLAHAFDAGIIYETLVLRRTHDANMSELYPMENYAEYIETFELLYANKWITKKHLYKAKCNAYYKMAVLKSEDGKIKEARHYYKLSLKYGWLHPIHFIRLLRSMAKRKELLRVHASGS